jgi:hypothetical protein
MSMELALMKRSTSAYEFSGGSEHSPRVKSRMIPQSAATTSEKFSLSPPVLLCIGLAPSLLKAQRAVWRSAGCIVTSAASISKAIVNIATGDFDLVLLGERLPIADRERLTFLIRSTGSSVPIVCIADTCGFIDCSKNSTPQNHSEAVLEGVTEVLAGNATTHPVVTRRSRQA